MAATATGVYSVRRDHVFSASDDNKSKKILILGGGSGGIAVASQLQNDGFTNVTVVEPKKDHYYQPIWSLVGGGCASNDLSVKPMKDIFPEKCTWIQKAAKTIDPSKNSVTLDDGAKVDYDYLVVAVGLETDWNALPGLKKAIDDPSSGVVSIYGYKQAEDTWNFIKDFKKGTALFTMPTTAVKCPGAPQKIMWLFEERMRDLGVRNDVTVEWCVPGGAMFGVKRYADMLSELQKERNVVPFFKHVLTKIDGEKKIATFKDLSNNEEVVKEFDLLHVVPPLFPPDVVKSSPLANASGFVEVDKHTLQSSKFPNVFALGDCTNTPNSKTAAAITKQAPVLIHNLQQLMGDKELNAKYNGYASCPLIVGKNRVILAEFGYDGKIMETFNPDTGKFPYTLIGQEGAMQQRFFYWMKEKMFPYVYWNLWVKGKWFGNSGPFKPNVVEDSDSQNK